MTIDRDLNLPPAIVAIGVGQTAELIIDACLAVIV
jgi:uncharacterized membrane protein YqaE (UPF0057 family)